MRFVKLSSEDIEKVNHFYESVMGYASHGLFYREGYMMGEAVATLSEKHPDDFFGSASQILKGRGWVEDIEFHFRTAVAHGSIEAFKSENPNCHRLRGIVKCLYEKKNKKRMECKEVECTSMGSDQCTFVLEEVKL